MTPRVHRFAAAAFGLTLTLGAAALFLSGPRTPNAPSAEGTEARPVEVAATRAAPTTSSRPVAPIADERPVHEAPVADEIAAEPVTPAPVTSARTSIVVLRFDEAKVELVTAATKPFACPPAEAPSAHAPRWRLLDRTSGALLAEGALTLPRLCDCPKERDHRRGCVVVHHSAVLRLKLPRLAARERLELVGAEGPVGGFDLPEAS